MFGHLWDWHVLAVALKFESNHGSASHLPMPSLKLLINLLHLDQFAIRCWITPSAGTTQHFWRVGAVSIGLDMQTDVVFCVLLGEARLQDWKHTPSRLAARALLFAKLEMNRWDLVGDADNHTTAPRASVRRPPHLVENQAGTSWDDAWYVGLTCIIVTLIHYRKARSKPDEQKSIV